ncbi:hypothetical protein ACFQ3Z_24205 [Streptomyces nogalater]
MALTPPRAPAADVRQAEGADLHGGLGRLVRYVAQAAVGEREGVLADPDGGHVHREQDPLPVVTGGGAGDTQPLARVADLRQHGVAHLHVLQQPQLGRGREPGAAHRHLPSQASMASTSAGRRAPIWNRSWASVSASSRPTATRAGAPRSSSL